MPLLVKPSFSILSSYCLARRRCTWRVHNLEEEPRRRGIWIRHRGIQIVVAEPWHSGRPHAQARSLTSAANVFEWWLGRGVSPWDEGDVAMAAEWGSQKHVGHDSWCCSCFGSACHCHILASDLKHQNSSSFIRLDSQQVKKVSTNAHFPPKFHLVTNESKLWRERSAPLLY